MTATSTVYNETELRAAFEAVQNPSDWKAAIDAVVTADKLAITIAAIDFIAGTPVNVSQPMGGMEKLETGKYGIRYDTFRVQSIGYRAGPAGP